MKFPLPKPLARLEAFPRSLALSLAVHGMVLCAGLLWARPWASADAPPTLQAHLEFTETDVPKPAEPREEPTELDPIETPDVLLVEQVLEEPDPVEIEPLWPTPDDNLAREMASMKVDESFRMPEPEPEPAPIELPVVAAALEPPPAPAPEPAPPVVVAAALVDGPGPGYPSISRRMGEEGTVLLELSVLVSGDVGSAKVIESSGFDRLDRAAREAALAWVFRPATRDGVPFQTTYRHRLTFRLDALPR